MQDGAISANLAAGGGDESNPFKSNPYFRAAAHSKSLGKLTKGKDLPRSEDDANQPFYHEHAVLSQAAYDPVKFKSNYQSLGYEVDDELSQKSRTVFYNSKKKSAEIAYKGTDPHHVSDLIADGRISQRTVPRSRKSLPASGEKVRQRTCSGHGAFSGWVTSSTCG